MWTIVESIRMVWIVGYLLTWTVSYTLLRCSGIEIMLLIRPVMRCMLSGTVGRILLMWIVGYRLTGAIIGRMLLTRTVVGKVLLIWAVEKILTRTNAGSRVEFLWLLAGPRRLLVPSM